ncbi:MAG: hypothetical protein OXE05_12685 [Chloroflexi bacterium]|nr:hypothetical protein [Chloroflexota bacterium]
MAIIAPEETDVESRLASIEERLIVIETRMETFATKADLRQLEVQMVKWMVGVQVILILALVAVFAGFAQVFWY